MPRTEPIDEILDRFERIEGLPMVQDVLRTVPCMTLVVDEDDRIAHANREFTGFLGLTDAREILGRRVGEVLRCLHATTSEKGCGTTVFCRYCGLRRGIHEASTCGEATCELRMLHERGGRLEAADLRVHARDLDLDGERLTLLALADLSDAKRREQLERIFFHDLLNSANVLKGLSWTLKNGAGDGEVADLLYRTVGQLVEEIRLQRMLAHAEQDLLVADKEVLDAGPLLEEVADQYRSHLLARDRGIEVDLRTAATEIRSDPALLRRVVGNLVKNALEATAAGETVTLSGSTDGDRLRIDIHNPSVIPDEVRFQVFNRSFSTKGVGRGIGTYSVKLLTERYLDGTVSFTSEDGAGTTFSVTLPAASDD